MARRRSRRSRLSAAVGGGRLIEPATDLAIPIAVANAISEIALARGGAAIGGLSLASEIRPVVQAEQRRAEAEAAVLAPSSMPAQRTGAAPREI